MSRSTGAAKALRPFVGRADYRPSDIVVSAKDMRQRGLPPHVIAHKLRCSLAVVLSALGANGRDPVAIGAAVRALGARGLDAPAIARRLGIALPFAVDALRGRAAARRCDLATKSRGER
jgi:hypothetical protein